MLLRRPRQNSDRSVCCAKDPASSEAVRFLCALLHDSDSGIGGFFVMRDNRGLAGLLPTMTPPVVYGRPLFQGLSYHDTPEGPSPEMCYLDGSAKPGEKHTYSILSINKRRSAFRAIRYGFRFLARIRK